MNKNIIAAFSLLILFASCASNYNIEGTSSVNNLDGKMLYLKIVKDDAVKNIDSCDVVHGKFHFKGSIDTVRVARLFMDEESIMPVVIEEGDITIRIDNAQQKVSGTELNDKLYVFMDKHNQLRSRLEELTHRQSQMIMDGVDLDEATEKLNIEAMAIAEEEDKLVTKFVEDNFDNVLGPFCFMMVTADLEYPMLTPWIEVLMTKATEKFKNDPYVKLFYETAQENQQRLNGMISPDEDINITGPDHQ